MIYKALDLSTAHITYEDSLKLAEETTFSVGDFEYGYFLFTKGHDNQLNNYSESFRKVHTYARKHDCRYIVLDCDADQIDTPELDTHEW